MQKTTSQSKQPHSVTSTEMVAIAITAPQLIAHTNQDLDSCIHAISSLNDRNSPVHISLCIQIMLRSRVHTHMVSN